MLAKMLPGLIASMILGMVFCVIPGGRSPEPARGGNGEVLAKPAFIPSVPEKRMAVVAPAAIIRRAGEHLAVAGGAGIAMADAVLHSAPPEPAGTVAGSILTGEYSPMAAPAGDSLPSTQAPARRQTAPLMTLGSRSVASERAFASMDGGNPQPYQQEVVGYAALPSKGLRVWGTAAKEKARQKQILDGASFYALDGTTYSVGFFQDWSIDSTLGLSVDILDYEIKSNHYLDTRKSEVDGYIMNAHYLGTVFEKYPVEGKIMYGRINNRGEGSIRRPGSGDIDPWREEKHKGNWYGVSAKIGYPMIFGDATKVLPEIGFQFIRLKEKAHTVHTPEPTRLSRFDSTSTTVPVTVTLKRDYEKYWGLFTPRLSLGWTREFDYEGNSVRTFGASAAGSVGYDLSAAPYRPDRIVYDYGQRDFWRFGAGVDLKTNSGWDITADYTREWAEKYYNDTFKLELSRCF